MSYTPILFCKFVVPELERAFEEERRPKITPRFFSEKPCLKLVYAVLDRVSGRWARIRFTASELEHLQALRAAMGLAPWKQR